MEQFSRRGFIINQVAADNKFATLNGSMSNIGIALNVVAAGEHIPEIGRPIRMLNKRCRAVFRKIGFIRMPNRMEVELVYAIFIASSIWEGSGKKVVSEGGSKTYVEVLKDDRKAFADDPQTQAHGDTYMNSQSDVGKGKQQTKIEEILVKQEPTEQESPHFSSLQAQRTPPKRDSEEGEQMPVADNRDKE